MESCLSLTLKQADAFPPPYQKLVLPQLAIFTTLSKCGIHVLYIHTVAIEASFIAMTKVFKYTYIAAVFFFCWSVLHMILQVRAVDDATPPRTGMAQVTVQVTNVNDNPPIISNPASERLHAQCALNSKHHPSLTVYLLAQIQVLPSVGRKTLCPQPCLL